MIYGIEGLYGSGKTSYAVYLMMNQFKDYTIWTNVQVDQQTIPNAIIFPDKDILEVMRAINKINDTERALYSKPREGSNIVDHDRDAFTRHVIFFDEGSSHINARDWKNAQTAIFQYLDQERKLFLDVYIMTPSSQTIDISYRRMIQAWVTLDVFMNFWFFKNIRVAKAIYKDINGQPLMESFIDKDEMGTPIMKQRPIIESMGWFYAPKYWKHYDDLHKNITDDSKLPRFYQEIVDDWIQEDEYTEESPKSRMYLKIFDKYFKKAQIQDLDSQEEPEAIDPKETN